MPKTRTHFINEVSSATFTVTSIILELIVILFFHVERQILICYRATELMTQELVHHDYKYSALKQTAHVPFHVLE